MAKSIFENLNQQQVQAVKTVQGPIMAVAGAGSGKTRVLTNRIAYLIGEIGISPSNILAITFTNRAAEEMRSRVFNLVDLPVNRMWISTFHAMGAKILRYDIHNLGYENDFQIIDQEDSIIITKNLLKDCNYDIKKFSPKNIYGFISAVKTQRLDIDYIFEPEKSVIAQIYPQYNNYLKNNNLVDFQDLLILTLKLLNKFPDVLKKYQSMFQYILVDEFQDTNDLQYQIIRQLAKEHRNIFIVGDEDQSIYAFRGSNIENIKKFMKDFPEHVRIVLNQNYRSRDNILKAANSVIKNNRNRIEKDLFSTLGPGEKIIHYKAGNDEEEAYYIYDKIRHYVKNGYEYNDIAILYRNNSMSRRFEDVFLKYNVPHKVVGNISFYKRKEIKDIVAYLHLIINKGDDFSFSRVYNVPKRGIGDVTFGKMQEYASENNLKLIDVIDEDHSLLSAKAKQSLLDLKNSIIELQENLERRNLLDTYDLLLEKSGYKKMLENNSANNDKAFEAERRLDNLNEFKTIILEKIKDYDLNFSNYEILSQLLNDLALHEEAENQVDANNSVKLMTVHSAKGLEFKILFIACLEQTLFPSSQSLQENNIDEERRLFYVALTRAKEIVYLTNCRSRFMYGHYMENLDSQFVDEIESDLVERKGMYKPKEIVVEKPLHRTKRILPENYVNITTQKKSVRLGDKIMHKSFGKGVIVDVQDDKVKVAFPKPTGIKILLRDHPSYEILEKSNGS